MRKAIFNNRFGDTITTDEILAPVHICGQLSCAIDEDVDNSDDIEAICGEEVAEQYREALDESDCDKARDIIDTTIFTTVEAMTFDQQVALYKKVSYSVVTFDHIEDDAPSRSVRAPESPKSQPRMDSSRSKRRTTARNTTRSQPTASATARTARLSTIRIVSRGRKVNSQSPDSPTSTRRTNLTTSVSIPATRNGEHRLRL